MGYSVTVNSDNFEAEVFQKSFEKPVLIDFYAQWCGPCQMLKPILEKIAQEYDLVVAKVNIDENKSLAHDYEVEGIPDVRLMHQGEMVNKFVGVLPEPQLRGFLAKHNIKSEIQTGLESIDGYLADEQIEKAEATFIDLVEKYPENRQIAIEMASFLIDLNQLENAEKLLDSVPEYEKEYFSKAQAGKQLIILKRACDNPETSSEADQLFRQASCLTLEGDYENALEMFLEVIGEDKNYKNDAAKKAMLAIFTLLGDENPLTKDYRKQLMMALY